MSTRDSSAAPRAFVLFGRAVAAITTLGAAIAAVGIVASMGMICYAVVMRYFVNRAPSWVDDSVSMILVGAVMLAAPKVLRDGGHIAVDIITNAASGISKRLVELGSMLAVAAVGAIFVVNGWATAESSHMLGLTSGGNLEAPVWMPQLLIPVGGLMLLIVCTEDLIRQMLGLPRPTTAGHGHGGVQNGPQSEAAP